MRVVHVVLNFTKEYRRGAKVQIKPAGVTEYPYKGISTKINKVSAVITGVSLALDLGNTWTANNSNTNGDRMVKSLIQVGGVAAGIGVGAAIAAVTGPTLGGVVAFVGISFVTGIIIDEACTALMNKAGVE